MGIKLCCHCCGSIIFRSVLFPLLSLPDNICAGVILRGAGWLCDPMKLISPLDGVCLLILIKSALMFSDARLLFLI